MNKQLKNILKKIYFLPDTIINSIYLFLKNVKFEKNLQIKGFVYIQNRGEIILGKNVRIRSHYKSNPICGLPNTRLLTHNTGKICIGSGTGISCSIIYSRENIRIGENVLIGAGVKIYDTDFHSINPYIRTQYIEIEEIPKTKSVIIEDFAFIGADSIILKGSTIGKYSIIGAGSVVSGYVPSGEIWAGNPARFIRKLTDEELKMPMTNIEKYNNF